MRNDDDDASPRGECGARCSPRGECGRAERGERAPDELCARGERGVGDLFSSRQPLVSDVSFSICARASSSMAMRSSLAALALRQPMTTPLLLTISKLLAEPSLLLAAICKTERVIHIFKCNLRCE